MRVAAVDIGTVTMRLLVADIDANDTITELRRDIVITHIGKDLSSTGKLNGEGMRRAFEAAEVFFAASRELGAERVICVATSAARDATNSAEFLEGLEARGFDARVIPGETEALLSYRGATYQRGGEDLLVIDPGGGSTECIFAHDARKTDDLRARSLDIGSRRLTDMFFHEAVATAQEIADARAYIAGFVTPFITSLPTAPRELIAMAGTATTLVTIRDEMAEYEPRLVHGQRVSAEDMDAIIARLAVATVEERRAIVGLEPQRAEVILAGVLIIFEIMRIAGLSSVTISDNDLLYGIILSADLF